MYKSFSHRRRKMLKVGRAKDMIACEAHTKIFQTTPTLGQTAPILND